MNFNTTLLLLTTLVCAGIQSYDTSEQENLRALIHVSSGIDGDNTTIDQLQANNAIERFLELVQKRDLMMFRPNMRYNITALEISETKLKAVWEYERELPEMFFQTATEKTFIKMATRGNKMFCYIELR